MSTTKLYEVVLVGQLGGQEIVNRWNYQGSVNNVPSGDAFGLLSAMGLVPTGGAFVTGSLAAKIAIISSNGLEWTQALCRSVFDPHDFIDLPFVPHASGLVSGDVEAGFVAFGCRSNRVRTDIGRGYKRFAGVNESAVNSFGALTSGVLSELQDVATAMGNVLTYTESSLTDTFTPVIVGRLKYTTPHGNTAYKYYANEATQAEHLAVGVTWEAYDHVRSQVSRQIGKGK